MAVCSKSIALAFILQTASNLAIDCQPYMGDLSCDKCEDLHTSQAGYEVCADDSCLEYCAGGCVLGEPWDAYPSNGGTQSITCQCHDNGCDQCDNSATNIVDRYFKLNFDFPCQICSNIPNCAQCTDFQGCQQCDQGYVLKELPGCGSDSDQWDGLTNPRICVPEGLVNEECDEYTAPVEPTPPAETDCFTCATKCTDLTSQDGCANDQCLETCKRCITGIAWDDPAQDSECQCHGNGCDQCPENWFKVDYDFPCQPCDELIGCMQCTDFFGCQQCEDGYIMVEHDTCGEDSVVYTGGETTKVRYCVPDDGSECLTGGTGGSSTGGGTGSTEPVCDTVDGCDFDICCDYDEFCNVCEDWGCAACDEGYFHLGFDTICTRCPDSCSQCDNWQGCTQCPDGSVPVWNGDCGYAVCP